MLTMLLPFASHTLMAQHQKIVPVTPEAAALAKANNYEVSMNTGVPNIGIPFFEISSGSLKLPIGISYHAGGFKITEKSTSVGLGWSLNCELQVTRTINGKDDFEFNGYAGNNLIKSGYTNYSQDDAASYDFYTNWMRTYNLATGTEDGAPDKFNYRLLGKSGSFYVQKSGDGATYTFVPAPYENIRIVLTNNQFIITDTDGTKYTFGQAGNSGNVGDPLSAKEFTADYIDIHGGCTNCKLTAWKCISIETASGTDRIDFEYAAKAQMKSTSYQDYVEWFYNPTPCNLETLAPYRTGNNFTQGSSLSAVLSQNPWYSLSSPKYVEHFAWEKNRFHIPYLNGTSIVDVVLEDDRVQDLNGKSAYMAGLALSKITFRGGTVVFTGSNELSSIQLKNSKQEVVKKVTFFSQYTAPANLTDARLHNGDSFNGTLYLDSLHIGSGSSDTERYTFLYKTKVCLGSHLVGGDTWGYYNNNTKDIYFRRNSDYNMDIPKQVLPYDYVTSTSNACAGTRTNAAFSFGNDNLKEYPDEIKAQYGTLQRIIYPTGGYTDFAFELNQYRLLQTLGNYQSLLPRYGGGLRIRTISRYDGINPLPASQKYYVYGENEDGTGLLRTNPSSTFKPNSTGFEATSYTQHVLYFHGGKYDETSPSCFNKTCMGLKTNEKKITYFPASNQDLTYQNGSPIYYMQVTEYDRDLGVVTGKTVHKYLSPYYFTAYQNMPSVVRATNIPYLYSDWPMGALQSVTSYKNNNGVYQPVHQQSFTYTSMFTAQQVRVVYAFLQNVYVPIAGTMHSGVSESVLYDPTYNFQSGDYLRTQSDFLAGQYHVKIGRILPQTKVETVFQGSESLTKTSTYYYDNPAYMQPTRIVTTNSKNQNVTQQLKYPYDFVAQTVYADMVAKNIISPVVEETNTVQSSTRKTITNYALFSGGTGLYLPTSVQTSTNSDAPVTEVTFNSYDSYGNLTQKTGIDGVTTAYLWGYNSQYPVAEVKGKTYTATKALITESILNQPLNDAQLIDNLNNLRSDAGSMVSSFTYLPLVGVSSMTGPEGNTQYYEYDHFGRLKLVRDYQSKIVKQMDYNYIDSFSTNATNGFIAANMPRMATFHFSECTPAVLNTYNRVLFGGTFNTGSSDYQNDILESRLQSGEGVMIPVLNSQCPSPLAHVQLKHTGMWFANAPATIDVMLVQNEHVIYRKQFKPVMTGSTDISYAPVGTYKIIWNPNPGFVKSFCGFWVYDGTTYVQLKSGDSFTFQPNVNYEIFSFDNI
ncbi:hypothetical protein [Chitinophaga sp. YIM B06452]|uniref:hypothetical protein n=1 Tax=Chitinophaga sp. YIM B06452 TaxID=3082158 RepID=UPI0031FEB356